MIRRSATVSTVARPRATTVASIAAGAALLALSTTSALAGSPGVETPAPVKHDLCAAHGESVKCITVLIDHLQRLELPTGVATILIGNPAIADINVLSESHGVVSARSIGSTNVLLLDADGAEVAHYVLIVREAELKRVTLRRGPGDAALYQCAPRCERTLTQNDSRRNHSDLAGILGTENSINNRALNSGGAAEEPIDEPSVEDQRSEEASEPAVELE